MKFVQKDIEEEIISCIFKRVKHIWLLYKWIYGYQCNRMLRILTHILTMSTLPHGHEKKGILLKKKKKRRVLYALPWCSLRPTMLLIMIYPIKFIEKIYLAQNEHEKFLLDQKEMIS